MRFNATLLNVNTRDSTNYNWRLFLLLWGMAAFGLLAVIPYVLSLQSNTLQAVRLPLPLPVVISVQVVLQLGILGLLTGIGLWLAEKIGFGAPVLADWLAGHPPKQEFKYTWLPIVLIGMAISAIVVFLDTLIFSPLIQNQVQTIGGSLAENITPPIWEGLLSSFYGGFTEEIMLRLFLMSLFIWLGRKFFVHNSPKPNRLVIWSAICLSSLFFGLGHLPMAIATGFPLNILGVSRILLLNGLPGLVFGWLYWRYGLESGMVAHFSGDIVLHVITPLLLLS